MLFRFEDQKYRFVRVVKAAAAPCEVVRFQRYGSAAQQPTKIQSAGEIAVGTRTNKSFIEQHFNLILLAANVAECAPITWLIFLRHIFICFVIKQPILVVLYLIAIDTGDSAQSIHKLCNKRSAAPQPM